MKYPAIYKSVEGSEYLYQNKDSYYCYERQLWDSSEPHHDCHHSDTNITAEYLANTYGEVKSKEHAEFIVKLAEVNGFEIGQVDDNPKSFMIYDNVICTHRLSHNQLSNGFNRKQITIPLPPECESKEENLMKEVKVHEKTDREKALELMHECYHEVRGDFYNFSQKFVDMVTLNECESVDEWPKVGDEVQTSDGVGAVKLLPDSKGYYVISIKDEYYQYQFDELSKPKTPEQELRDEISDLAFNQFNDDSYDLTHNSYYLAEQLISKYNITKKPQ